MKTCIKCKKEKEIYSFSFTRNKKARRDKCRKCCNEENLARKQENMQRILELKEESPCSDCNKYYEHYVMDFDHIRGKKHRAVSRMYYHSWESIKKEIQKCELVCANCHRKRTFLRRGHTTEKNVKKSFYQNDYFDDCDLPPMFFGSHNQ